MYLRLILFFLPLVEQTMTAIKVGVVREGRGGGESRELWLSIG